MTTRFGVIGRSLAATLAIGASLTLAGCGNEQSGPGYANSGSNSGGVAYADEALTKDEIMRVTAEAAKKAGTMHMDMSMSGKATMDAEGDIDYGKGKLPLMSMTMSMPQLGKGKMEMRFVGGKIYMSIPGVTPAGKFLAIDPKDKTSPFAKSFAGTTNQLDPMGNLTAVQKSVRSAERVGKQTMDGETVEHYKVDVDTAAMIKKMGLKTAQLAKVPDTITYDLWLDDQHRAHRVSFQLSGVDFEASMSKFGKPVKVARPSAGQIATPPQV